MDLLRFGPLKWLIKKRWFQFLTQVPNLLIFYLVIATGFFGAVVPGKNISTIITWTVWWVALIFIFAFFGRSWCLICPFAATSDILQRMSFFRKTKHYITFNFKWPNKLKNYYTTTLFLGFVLYMDYRYAVTTNPVLTAWIALIITGGAVIISFFFQERDYCRYVCPLALLNAVPTVFAPVAIRSKDKDVCKNCYTKECIKGSPDGWGCPLGLYPGGLDESLNCVLCMECVKTCPYDNMTVVSRPFGWETLRKSGEGLMARFDTGVLILFFVIMMGMFPLFVIDWIRGMFTPLGVPSTVKPILPLLTTASLSTASFYFFSASLISFAVYYLAGYMAHHLVKDKWKQIATGVMAGAVVTSALSMAGTGSTLGNIAGFAASRAVLLFGFMNAIILAAICYAAKKDDWRPMFSGTMAGATLAAILTHSSALLVPNILLMLVAAAYTDVKPFIKGALGGLGIASALGFAITFAGIGQGTNWVGFTVAFMIIPFLLRKAKVIKREGSEIVFSGWFVGGTLSILFVTMATSSVAYAMLPMLTMSAGYTLYSTRKSEWVNYGTVFALALVPYGIAIHLDHNWGMLLSEAWRTIVSASDPFAFGWNLLGTATMNKEQVFLGAFGLSKFGFTDIAQVDQFTRALIFYLSHITLIMGFVFSSILTWKVSKSRFGSRALHVYVPFFILMLASLVMTYNTIFHVPFTQKELATALKANDIAKVSEIRQEIGLVRTAMLANMALATLIVARYVRKWRGSDEAKKPPMEFKAQVIG